MRGLEKSSELEFGEIIKSKLCWLVGLSFYFKTWIATGNNALFP